MLSEARMYHDTPQEAELFLLSSIKAKRRKDTNVHDVVLEENKFIKTMMKYGHGNTVGNSNEAEEKLFSSSSGPQRRQQGKRASRPTLDKFHQSTRGGAAGHPAAACQRAAIG